VSHTPSLQEDTRYLAEARAIVPPDYGKRTKASSFKRQSTEMDYREGEELEDRQEGNELGLVVEGKQEAEGK
jgi:hypothetical protein